MEVKGFHLPEHLLSWASGFRIALLSLQLAVAPRVYAFQLCQTSSMAKV